MVRETEKELLKNTEDQCQDCRIVCGGQMPEQLYLSLGQREGQLEGKNQG